MNGWAVFGLILLALFLLGQVRVGVRAEYAASGLSVWLRLGGLRLKLFPFKPKARKKSKPPKAEQPKAAPTAAAKRGGEVLPLLRELLPVLLEGAGAFYNKLRMDILTLELTVGAADPADAAMRYGQANAILGAIWGPVTHAFHVKDGHAGVRMDFDSDTFAICATAALSLKIWQGLWLGAYFGIRALAGLLRVRKAKKEQIKQQQRKAA